MVLAIWAPCVCGTIVWRRLPTVPVIAPPPDRCVTMQHYLLGEKISVFLIIPLSSKIRCCTQKIIFANHQFLSAANRAADYSCFCCIREMSVCVNHLTDRCFPRMSSITNPMRLEMRLRCIIFRFTRTVFGIVPLLSKNRIYSFQISFSENRVFSRTVWAPPPFRPVVNCSCPVHPALRAMPPNLLVAFWEVVLRSGIITC